jgi:hypothetical protein
LYFHIWFMVNMYFVINVYLFATYVTETILTFKKTILEMKKLLFILFKNLLNTYFLQQENDISIFHLSMHLIFFIQHLFIMKSK